MPVDALPVSRIAPVAGGSQDWVAQVAARTSEQLEAAIVSASPETDGLAGSIASQLRAKRLNAYVAELRDVRRPDVILLLDASDGGASVWYCSPSQAASGRFAAMLEDATVSLPEEPTSDGQTAGVAAAMPCNSLHLGRASSAAALVRLPSLSGATGEELTRSLVDEVTRYLDENAATIRLGRQALRMVWPAIGPITSHYGNDHPLGIDIGQSSGPIVAATDGTVIFAGGDACCSYGRFVVIAGPANVTTLYAHLETISVREGDRVRLGQPIGEVGCTGRCFGTHLHFEVIRAGERLNPMDFLP